MCISQYTFYEYFIIKVSYKKGIKIMNLRIRNLREDKDLKQKDIAKLLNCTQQTYSRYATGENNIDIHSLIKLADFYNTSIDYIVGRTNNPKRI